MPWWKLPNSSCHFWKHKSVFLQTLHHFSVPSNTSTSTLYFFTSNIIYFGQKQRIKVQMFEILECLSKNVLHFVWQVNSFSNFASFFIAMTHSSPVNFKLLHFILWIKGSHESPNFKALKCSDENLPKLSCHFLNYKSIFLQFFHHSRVSWKITLLHFFSASIIYFGQNEPIKCKFLRLLSARVKVCQISYVNFETTSQFLFKFLIILRGFYTQLFYKVLVHSCSTLDKILPSK